MDNTNGNAKISRSHLEKALWEMTGWQGDQVVIDGILLIHDAIVASDAESLAKSPESFREGYYHSLVTMAEAVLDTGGRMRLVPPEAEPVLRAGDVDALAAAILAKLPVAAERADDERLLANPDLLESLEQMHQADVGPEVIPAREEVEVEVVAPPAADAVVPGLSEAEVAKFMATLTEQDEFTGDIKCTTCSAREGHDVYKPYTDFYRDSKGAHGRKSRCKTCEQKRKRGE